VPAGWLFHGLNDAFDAEADAANPRKAGVERAGELGRSALLGLAAAGAALYAPLALVLPSASSVALLAALAGAVAYNVPPLRLKTRPWLDGLAYLVPLGSAAAGYAAVTGGLPPLSVLALGLAFSFAMHLYSAAIDADADRAAGAETVAVRLGAARAVRLALGLVLAVALACAAMGGASWAIACAAYAALFAAHLARAGRPGFSPRRWYAAFLALHFFAGAALSAAYL
jgi:4-hydroxybenzoate polyprenyltransferase